MKRVALAGFGFMGYTHAANIMRTRGLSLAAIVERNPVNIERNLREQTGNFATGAVDPAALECVPVYPTLEECLQGESVDVVDICLPTLYHFETAKLALDRGKDVLLEKPFGLDPARCRELIDIARRGNLILMVAHVVRFMPEYEFLKAAVEEERYGRPRFLLFSRTAGAPSWGDWRADAAVRKGSGGGLYDLVIHDIDFLNSLLGVPRSVDCLALPGPLSDWDYIDARWDYADGPKALVQGGVIFHTRHPFEARYVVRLEKASLEFSSRNPGFVSVATDDGVDNVRVEAERDGFFKEIGYFAQCVENRTWPARCPPEASLEAIELCRRHVI